MRQRGAMPWRPGWPVEWLQRIGPLHPTSGLPGYPAYDFFARARTRVLAPVDGRVSKLSGHDPNLGPIEGPHGPFGWSVYLTTPAGAVYYLTHLGTRYVELGEFLHAGDPMGTVGDYAKYGTPSHVHMGIHPAPHGRQQ